MDLQARRLLLDRYQERAAGGVDISGHMPYLREQAAARPGVVVAEFGVRDGNSTAAFLAGLLDHDDDPGHLWSVDIEQPTAPHWFHAVDRWSFLRADALGDEAQAWIPAEIDVLFVDLDPHTREQTTAMIEAWLPRVRPGGVALFHDTQWYGGTGVWDALDDYAAATGQPWQNRQGSNGLGVITVPGQALTRKVA